MSYKVERIGSPKDKNDFKNPAYEDQFIDWLLSEYQDETQLLSPQELQNRLALIEHKVLISEENLFLIKSILKIARKQLKIDFQKEQKLTIIMLDFIEKAQKEQLKKIKNSHAITGKILLWSQGKIEIVNTIFRTILQSETFLNSNYVENLTLWLTSEKKDRSQLLTGENLELALMYSHPRLTKVENQFLVRSLVFNLRGG